MPAGPEHGGAILPKPEQKTQTTVESAPEMAPTPIEVAPEGRESANQNQGQPMQPSIQPAKQQQATVTQPTASQNPTPVSTSPAVAADQDDIEKAWIDQAKTIVNQTRQDPYLQEKEVSKLQAHYLQKRYGKKIKSKGS